MVVPMSKPARRPSRWSRPTCGAHTQEATIKIGTVRSMANAAHADGD